MKILSMRISQGRESQMVAAEKTIGTSEEAAVCSECHGSGMVAHWNEVAYFEDRRACTRCEAGRKVDSEIAEIVKRARIEERLSRR
jgi:DnaJ-class molecular chaperone